MNREQIISKVTEWATQMELTVRNLEDPAADFHIIVSQPNLPVIDIIHPNINSTYVIVACRASVSETDQKKILDLQSVEVDELLWNIRLTLLSMNVEFRMVGPEGSIPAAWEVHSKLFLEGANAQHFSDVYVKVKNAILFVIWSYKRALDVVK